MGIEIVGQSVPKAATATTTVAPPSGAVAAKDGNVGGTSTTPSVGTAKPTVSIAPLAATTPAAQDARAGAGRIGGSTAGAGTSPTSGAAATDAVKGAVAKRTDPAARSADEEREEALRARGTKPVSTSAERAAKTPVKPAKASGPAAPAAGETTKPNGPVRATETAQPAEPAKTLTASEPGKTTQPLRTTKPVTTTEPVKTTEPTTSTKPTKQVTPVVPVPVSANRSPTTTGSIPSAPVLTAGPARGIDPPVDIRRTTAQLRNAPNVRDRLAATSLREAAVPSVVELAAPLVLAQARTPNAASVPAVVLPPAPPIERVRQLFGGAAPSTVQEAEWVQGVDARMAPHAVTLRKLSEGVAAERVAGRDASATLAAALPTAISVGTAMDAVLPDARRAELASGSAPRNNAELAWVDSVTLVMTQLVETLNKLIAAQLARTSTPTSAASAPEAAAPVPAVTIGALPVRYSSV